MADKRFHVSAEEQKDSGPINVLLLMLSPLKRSNLLHVFFLFFTLIASGLSNRMALAADRVALVIGNASYQSAPLKNPVNDANDSEMSVKRIVRPVTGGKHVPPAICVLFVLCPYDTKTIRRRHS